MLRELQFVYRLGRICRESKGIEGPELYRHLVSELNKLDLAYLHIMHQGNEDLLVEIRNKWSGILILNRPSRAREHIGDDVTTGLADIESYGQMVLANPDFKQRIQIGAPLNEAKRESFFGGDAKGYTDYPVLNSNT